MLLPIICIALYGLCTVLLWRNINAPGDQNQTGGIYLAATAAVVLHAAGLYRDMNIPGETLISLGSAVSTAGWISALLYLLLSLRIRIIELGLIVFPISILAALAGILATGSAVPLSNFPANVQVHILLAIPTYGVLFTAFAQACLLVAQDRQLRKGVGGRISTLPPIQSMESYLFFLIVCGFALMTLNLALGMFSHGLKYGRMLEFNHHVVFSLAAWVSFGTIIAGRYVMGWRGEIAAKWTIAAFSLLVLAYFGTRFVNELILIQ